MLNKEETLEILKSLGHKPNHSFGQNFLINPVVVQRTVRTAEVKAGETVVEVGPGLGTLTKALLMAGAELVSIEKDKKLMDYLKETFKEALADGQWKLIESDATKVDYALFNNYDKSAEALTFTAGSLDAAAGAAQIPVNGKGFKVVANLPYAVATPLMENFIAGQPTSMTLMIQKELATRWLAKEGRDFSAMSIFLQSAYKGGVAFNVPPKCFHPAPAVDSVIVHFERKEQAVYFTPERHKLVRTLFLNRRKQIHKAAEANPVSAAWFSQIVAEGLVTATVRAEAIPLELWQRLATQKI